MQIFCFDTQLLFDVLIDFWVQEGTLKDQDKVFVDLGSEYDEKLDTPLAFRVEPAQKTEVVEANSVPVLPESNR